MPKSRVLLTAFGPFDDAINASAEVLTALRQRKVTRTCNFAVLDCDGRRLPAQLEMLFAEHQPRLWLLTGQARDRGELSVECVAYNQLDFRAPDLGGWQPRGEPVTLGGPNELYTTLPDPEGLVGRLVQRGFPVRLSVDPGRYLCNQAYYWALQHAAPHGVMVGFVHVPALPGQTTPPGIQPLACDAACDALEGLVTELNVMGAFAP